MRTLKRSFAVALAAVLIPLASAEEPRVADARLEQMALAAQTPAEHVAVAKQYRQRAESFKAAAQRHETEARVLEARPRSPLEYKWPAMSRQPWVKERQLAIQARRAASECLAVAERHMRLGVEALAENHQDQPAKPSGSDN